MIGLYRVTDGDVSPHRLEFEVEEEGKGKAVYVPLAHPLRGARNSPEVRQRPAFQASQAFQWGPK